MGKQTEQLQHLSAAYGKGAAAGDRQSCRDAVNLALGQGASVFAIYENLITPALREIGRQWANESISISEEHLATQITLEQITLLREKISPKPELGKKALVTTLPKDLHIVGARMVADYFYADGWDVEFLGPQTPIEEIIRFVEEKKIDVVLISICSAETVSECNELAVSLKALSSPPMLIVGGRALGDPALRRSLDDIDFFAEKPNMAVSVARKKCGISGSEISLQQVLQQLGRKISQLRSDKRMSQKALSNASDLDRAYLSSIENGKKNVTLSSMLKISEALDTTIIDLLQD